jgi:hypothetical protein
MKTITEFSGFTLKDSIAKKAAMIAEGKTEEEAQTAVHEQLKLLDETKVAFYKNALDMSKSRLDQVKRVVVAVKSSETEKVPEAFSEREGNFYLIEYFAQAGASAARGRGDDRDFKGRDSRGGRGFKGRDGGRGRGGEGRGEGRGEPRGESRPAEGRGEFRSEPRGEARPPRGPRPERAPRGDRPAVNAAPGAPQERKPRPPKSTQPRAPRAPRPNQGPKGAAELRLVLKGQSTSTLQGSGVAEAPATSADTQQA